MCPAGQEVIDTFSRPGAMLTPRAVVMCSAPKSGAMRKFTKPAEIDVFQNSAQKVCVYVHKQVVHTSNSSGSKGHGKYLNMELSNSRHHLMVINTRSAP